MSNLQTSWLTGREREFSSNSAQVLATAGCIASWGVFIDWISCELMVKKCAGKVPEMRNDSVILCVMYRIARATIDYNLNESGEVRHSRGRRSGL